MLVYRNREGLNLLTGTPNQRSLRIWLNYSSEPHRMLRKPGTSQQYSSSFEEDTETLNAWGQPCATGASDAVPTSSTNPYGSRILMAYMFDSNVPSRREFEIGRSDLKALECSSHGELYAILNDGRAALIAKNQSSNDHLGERMFQATQFDEDLDGKDSDFKSIIKLPKEKNGFKGEGNEHWLWSNYHLTSLIPVEQVSCGREHICCFTDACSGGLLYSWGNNLLGQCGHEVTKQSKIITRPMRVREINGTALLSCGPEYTCCITVGDSGYRLHSFGGVPNQSKFPNYFKSNVAQESSLPHADASDLGVAPCLAFDPGTSNMKMRPFRFWTETLGHWIEDVDDEWVSRATLPLTRLSHQDISDIPMELDISQSRLRKMRNALETDVAKCALFPTEDILDDPAPFEIQKVLTNIEYELESNTTQQDLMKDNVGFEDDVEFLVEERDRILESKSVYEYVKQIWEKDSHPVAPKRCDREVLYALLEDCRRSELSFLAKEEESKLKRLGTHGRSASVSFLSLIEQSEAILDEVKQGLDAFECPRELKALHDAVVLLHAKKQHQNDLIRSRFETMVDFISDPLRASRDTALKSGSDEFDLSHLQ